MTTPYDHPNGLVFNERKRREDLFPSTIYEGSIVLMSIGPEGTAWLGENAPGWHEHVSLRKFKVTKAIMDQTAGARAPDALIQAIRVGMIYEISDYLISQVEPKIRMLDSNG